MNEADTSLTIKSAGFWLAAIGGLLLAVNSVQAFFDPTAFATNLGLPLVAPDDDRLTYIDALRTLCVAALLVIRRRR